MVLKAVCVLKGAGETTGTVYFEQEVKPLVYLFHADFSFFFFFFNIASAPWREAKRGMS